jgi:hypothetical protein
MSASAPPGAELNQALCDYAEWIGIDPEREPELMWIADKGLHAPVPRDWVLKKDPQGNLFYVNTATNQVQKDHPADAQYRRLAEEERAKRGGTSTGFGSGGGGGGGGGGGAAPPPAAPASAYPPPPPPPPSAQQHQQQPQQQPASAYPPPPPPPPQGGAYPDPVHGSSSALVSMAPSRNPRRAAPPAPASSGNNANSSRNNNGSPTPAAGASAEYSGYGAGVQPAYDPRYDVAATGDYDRAGRGTSRGHRSSRVRGDDGGGRRRRRHQRKMTDSSSSSSSPSSASSSSSSSALSSSSSSSATAAAAGSGSDAQLRPTRLGTAEIVAPTDVEVHDYMLSLGLDAGGADAHFSGVCRRALMERMPIGWVVVPPPAGAAPGDLTYRQVNTGETSTLHPVDRECLRMVALERAAVARHAGTVDSRQPHSQQQQQQQQQQHAGASASSPPPLPPLPVGSDTGLVAEEVLEERLDTGRSFSDAEVRTYAAWLGMDPAADSSLLWIAREGLSTPMPRGWLPVRSTGGRIFYHDFEGGGGSTWEHPVDAIYKRLYRELKAVGGSSAATNHPAPGANLASGHYTYHRYHHHNHGHGGAGGGGDSSSDDKERRRSKKSKKSGSKSSKDAKKKKSSSKHKGDANSKKRSSSRDGRGGKEGKRGKNTKKRSGDSQHHHRHHHRHAMTNVVPEYEYEYYEDDADDEPNRSVRFAPGTEHAALSHPPSPSQEDRAAQQWVSGNWRL